MEYSIEVFKKDARRKSGERLVAKRDLGEVSLPAAQDTVASLEAEGFRVTLHETYVTSRNVLTGEEFQERYDRPYYCSPRSETYWCS